MSSINKVIEEYIEENSCQIANYLGDHLTFDIKYEDGYIIIGLLLNDYEITSGHISFDRLKCKNNDM
jgi:hypothetical protein